MGVVAVLCTCYPVDFRMDRLHQCYIQLHLQNVQTLISIILPYT